jgi:hypothetical protein
VLGAILEISVRSGKTTFVVLSGRPLSAQSEDFLVRSIALRGSSVTAWRSSLSYGAQDPVATLPHLLALDEATNATDVDAGGASEAIICSSSGINPH